LLFVEKEFSVLREADTTPPPSLTTPLHRKFFKGENKIIDIKQLVK